MARAIRNSGGSVLRVSERQIAAARASLAATGYPTDATGATAWAGLQQVHDRADEGPERTPPRQTVVLLTSRAAQAPGKAIESGRSER
jgi:threonine synthase